MTKKIMTWSEAETIVRAASEAFFAALEKVGIVVEEGRPDGAGVPFTAARVEEIQGGVDAAGWVVLAASYTIVNDDQIPVAFPSIESYYEEGLV